MSPSSRESASGGSRPLGGFTFSPAASWCPWVLASPRHAARRIDLAEETIRYPQAHCSHLRPRNGKWLKNSMSSAAFGINLPMLLTFKTVARGFAMIGAMRSLVVSTGWLVQRLMFLTLAASGLGLLGYTLACAFGYAPWLEMTATFGGVAYPQAGPAVQIGLTALVFGFCAFLPANARIMALETSHRRFQICMEDVARAYRLSHAADRDGVFRMRSEFDSVRERMAFLRDHPDLAELEPSVLEVASQMSHVSRDLARTYSESSVARARDFLVQRQQEIEEFNTRLDAAKATASEMRVWADKVALEESVAQAQLARLNAELADILPELHKGTDTPTIPARQGATAGATPEPATEDGHDPDDIPDTDDNRIVALLA